MTRQNTGRDDRTLQRRLAELERRLQKLETSPRAGNASVSHGKFLVQDGSGGTELFRIGYLGQGAAGEVRGTAMNRPTGETVFATWDGLGTDTGGFWGLYDAQGNIIFSDDAQAGQGLATPFIGSPMFAPDDGAKWPVCTTSSYSEMWYSMWIKQHPRLRLNIWTRTDATTSGDIQVTCGGVSASQAVGTNNGTVREFILTVPGSHLSNQDISISMRRTAGTGFMGCWPVAVHGIQS